MAVHDIKGVFLQEELGQLPHIFSHLDSHDFPVDLDLGDRVTGRQAGKRRIVDVDLTELAETSQVFVGGLVIEVLLSETSLSFDFLDTRQFSLLLKFLLVGNTGLLSAVLLFLLLGLLLKFLLLRGTQLLRIFLRGSLAKLLRSFLIIFFNFFFLLFLGVFFFGLNPRLNVTVLIRLKVQVLHEVDTVFFQLIKLVEVLDSGTFHENDGLVLDLVLDGVDQELHGVLKSDSSASFAEVSEQDCAFGQMLLHVAKRDHGSFH